MQLLQLLYTVKYYRTFNTVHFNTGTGYKVQHFLSSQMS